MSQYDGILEGMQPAKRARILAALEGVDESLADLNRNEALGVLEAVREEVLHRPGVG